MTELFEVENPSGVTCGKSSRSTLQKLALAVVLASALPMGNVALAAPPTVTMKVATDVDPKDPGTMWATKVLVELGKRLNVKFDFLPLPMARRNAELPSGEIDVDAGRIASYGAGDPKIVRVETPWNKMSFDLYSAKPGEKFANMDEVKAKNLNIEYRRGVVFCQKNLEAAKIQKLSDITSETQAFSKLLAGRIDLFCDVETTARRGLNTPEFKDKMQIHSALRIGSVNIHYFTNEKHKDFAVKMSDALKKMTDEGLLEKFGKEVDKELNLTR